MSSSPPVVDLDHSRAHVLLGQALTAEPARLDLAALSVALLEFPELDITGVLDQLDRLAERVWMLVSTHSAPIDQVQALRQVLVDEEGFRGDQSTYGLPENSFLNRVLERRVGLPITLAAVYIEVGRRAGIPLFGVSFPGHFVIARDLGPHRLVLDPFHNGQVLTEEGCKELLRKVAPQVRFTPSMIAPAPVKNIAYRMLNNLKRLYLEQNDGERSLKVVDLMLALVPDHPGELRTRASILSTLGGYRAALADIERCLELSPHAPDQQSLLLTARALQHRVHFLN